MKTKYIVWIILAIILIIFGITNTHKIELNFFKTFNPRAIIVILISFVLGFIGGMITRRCPSRIEKSAEKSKE